MRFHEKNPGVFTPGFWTEIEKQYVEKTIYIEVCFVNGSNEITL